MSHGVRFARMDTSSRSPLTGHTKTVAAIVVAAGRGLRAGLQSEGPKQFRQVGDRVVLERAVDCFIRCHEIREIIVVVNAEDRDKASECLPARPSVRFAIGGATRQLSVRAGLDALAGAPPDLVLIHDAARPFLDRATIARVIDGIEPDVAALPAVPLADTLKRATEDGFVGATVDRTSLFGAQTPQGFAYPMIRDAHERAAAAGLHDFTDDTTIAEWAGNRTKIVPGSLDNVKLTFPSDFERAEQTYGRKPVIDVRTGNGYDVHQLVPGNGVTLCGVHIPHDQALAGHSDADVGLHALTDALLATCGAGDIGTHFPPTDPQWRGAASRIFVEHAVKLVQAKGGTICNVDVTLIAEAPRVGPHRAAMLAAMAKMTGLGPDRISVKATTNETIGFVGRREGIAAIATASVVYGPERT